MSVHHHFAPGWFTYALVFSDYAPVNTAIINTEELVQKVFFREELVRAGIFLLHWCFYLLYQGEFPPNTMRRTPLIGNIFNITQLDNLTLYISWTSILTAQMYSLTTLGWMWHHTAMIQFIVCILGVIYVPNLRRIFKIPGSNIS